MSICYPKKNLQRDYTCDYNFGGLNVFSPMLQLATQSSTKLITTLQKESFMKCGFNFNGPMKTTKHFIRNKCILLAIDYIIKWVEAITLCTNTAMVIMKFLYKFILIRFQCLINMVTNLGVHFINKKIKYLTNQFVLTHLSSTIYYSQ